MALFSLSTSPPSRAAQRCSRAFCFGPSTARTARASSIRDLGALASSALAIALCNFSRSLSTIAWRSLSCALPRALRSLRQASAPWHSLSSTPAAWAAFTAALSSRTKSSASASPSEAGPVDISAWSRVTACCLSSISGSGGGAASCTAGPSPSVGPASLCFRLLLSAFSALSSSLGAPAASLLAGLSSSPLGRSTPSSSSALLGTSPLAPLPPLSPLLRFGLASPADSPISGPMSTTSDGLSSQAPGSGPTGIGTLVLMVGAAWGAAETVPTSAALATALMAGPRLRSSSAFASSCAIPTCSKLTA
mmetsp:Transcript_58109/g.165140  ORF Transcript_58109/g.165140 Transcript_58109/m.165140 type:complete len:307 (+) Transcript_58109:1972-2892(+)